MKRKVVEVVCFCLDKKVVFKTLEEAEAFLEINKMCAPGQPWRMSITYDEPETNVFLQIVAGVITAVLVIVTGVVFIIGWLQALPVLFTETLPAIANQIGALGTTIYNYILPSGSIVRNVIDWVVDQVDTYVIPTLKWVYAQVVTISESIYKVYTDTIGGIVTVYDNLFGWLDDLQNKVNAFMMKVEALIAIVDEDFARRLRALREEINDFIDKWTSDIFDTVIDWINEAVGPILKRIDELKAWFDESVSFLDGRAKDLEGYNKMMKDSSFVAATDTEVEVYTVNKQPPEEQETPEEAYKPPPTPPPKPPTAWEKWFSRWIGSEMTFWNNVLEELHDTMDETVEDIVNETYNLVTWVDRDIFYEEKSDIEDPILAWLLGEASFKDAVFNTVGYFWQGKGTPTSQEQELRFLDRDIQIMREQGYPEDILDHHREVYTDAINESWERKKQRREWWRGLWRKE